MKSRAAWLAFAIGVALTPRAWAGNTFEAVLVGSNEVPGPGIGEGSFVGVVVLEGTKITLTLTPKEVKGRMSAHIHKGVAGVAGRLVAEFPWASAGGAPLAFAAAVSEKDAADLIAIPEKFYVDVHTESFPAGAARGQLAARPNATASPGPVAHQATLVGYDEWVVQAMGAPPPLAPPPFLADVQRMGQLPLPLPPGAAPMRPGPGFAGPAPQGATPRPQLQDAPETSPPSPRKDQTINFRPPRSPAYRDPDFTLDASASSGLRVFFTASGDCAVYGSTVHILSAGKCYVTAHQSGDSRFEAAPDIDRVIPIAKAGQRIAGFAPETKTYLDPDFPLAMNATSGLSVVFFAWGDCTVSGPYIHITGAGSCSLTAHQPGDSNYLAARIIDQQFPIAKADQTIEFAEFGITYSGEYDLQLNARASSGLPVVFSAFGSCGVVGTSVRAFNSGECWITADQPGDRNFNAAPSVKHTLQIVLPTPTPRV